MTTEFPDDPVDGFPAPPRTVTDKTGREITLRRAETGDVDALTEMYVEFDPEDRAQGIPPGSESAIREWLEIVMADDTLDVLATHESAPVGHVMLVPDRHGAFELAIFVLQAYQGAHIGTELVRTALGLASEEGIECIWLTVERWNTPAIALYEKIGFERTSDDSFEIEMSLRLATAE
jgi:RimJ/RimL family protein N-acetyltransferase